MDPKVPVDLGTTTKKSIVCRRRPGAPLLVIGPVLTVKSAARLADELATAGFTDVEITPQYSVAMYHDSIADQTAQTSEGGARHD